MSKKKKKFIKALKEWDVSEPIYLSDILKGHKESMSNEKVNHFDYDLNKPTLDDILAKDKESKSEINAAKIADKLIAEVKRQFAETEKKFNKEPMEKKLSELKENEYVFCKTEEEAKRVFNKVSGPWFYDQYGTSINPIAIAHKGTFIVHPSKDIADYEAPVPKKPKKSEYNVLSSEKSYLLDLEAYSDYLEQIIKDKDKYIAHMEKESERRSNMMKTIKALADAPCPFCDNQ